MKRFIASFSLAISLGLSACASSSGPGIVGNEGGSEPINASEEQEYKRAVLKCYKTGGSRVVKIEGRLMCY
ncbi:MAG: hypothetical protein ACOVS5_12175 [Oligoflexus sp.]|jgi:hypothetical protein